MPSSIKPITVDGQEFPSLSKACNYYDISYRDMTKYATKHKLSNEKALVQMSEERKKMRSLMFTCMARPAS